MMSSMRARLLAAMGLASTACPQPKQPSAVATADDAAPPVVTASDSSTDVFVEEVAQEASVEAAIPEAAIADAKPKKKSPGPEPLPSSAWYVTYPLSKPPAAYCKTGTAVCVPLDWAVQAHGKPGQATCPAEIVEKCRCPAGSSCDDDIMGAQTCPDTFHTAITNKERAAGKKTACCYEQPVMCTPPWVGRNLRSEGDAIVLARPTNRTEWLGAAVLVDRSLTESERGAVASHFAEVAAGEHASVASFAHVSLELMAHAAPADLIEATHRAALDEIEHARLAYALASEFGGAPIGPGPLPTQRSRATSLCELAIATLRDACIPEAVGALLAAEVARVATVPAIRGAMQRIAKDEARHAELAYRTLAWTVRAGGEEVVRAIESFVLAAPQPSRTATLPSHGLLGQDVERAIIADAMSSVVVPCIRALLESS
jgi:hypothetical protein